MTFPCRLAVALAAALFVAYSAAYFHLSRRGGAWCRPHNFHGFLYVLPGDCKDWYEWHHVCRAVFGPANRLERACGGELYPVSNICFGLSK